MSKWISLIKAALILIIFEEDCIVCILESCDYSLRTVEYVASCPSNKLEAAQSSLRKNCEHHAKLQSCTHPEKFKYHCVINTKGDKNIEVCAPGKKVNGFCTEFDTEEAIIQDNYYFDCTNYTSPCPKQYNSTEAYLYKDCYKCNWEAKTFSSNNHSTEKSQKLPLVSVVAIICSGVVVVLVPVILLVFYLRLKKKSRKNTNRDTRNGNGHPPEEIPLT